MVSANVVNNGACAALEPALWEGFKVLGVPLLDIHKQNQYAQFAHTWFFEHYADRLGQPLELIPTTDWLSINCIGYDYRIACEFAAKLGTVPHPQHIAGRNFPAPWGIMDEGLTNMFPRLLLRGFTACHLTFGPQSCTGEQCEAWRKCYAEVVREYLWRVQPDDCQLPDELSPVQSTQGGLVAPEPREENDPRAGRFTA